MTPSDEPARLKATQPEVGQWRELWIAYAGLLKAALAAAVEREERLRQALDKLATYVGDPKRGAMVLIDMQDIARAALAAPETPEEP